MRKPLWIILLTLLTSQMLMAEENYSMKGRWGLGIGMGLGLPSVIGPTELVDGALALKGGLAGHIWGRYHYTDRLAVEVGYSNLNYKFTSDLLSSIEPNLSVLDIAAAYRMWPTQALHFLLQAGVGVAHMSNGAGSIDFDAEFTVKMRIGLEYMAASRLMVALYGDFYRINLDNEFSPAMRVLTPVFAATYYFGKRDVISNADSDADGVLDSVDKCPGTPKGANVGADGCALNEKRTADEDGDGVEDALDRCPSTPAGQTVNEYGCASTEKAEFTLNIKFSSGSSQVDPKFSKELESFAEFLKKYPAAKAEIEGHTDNTGVEAFNFKISEKRARAVRAFIVKTYGISQDRLTFKGYGPSQPIGDNSTEEGRLKNRRVVAHVTSL